MVRSALAMPPTPEEVDEFLRDRSSDEKAFVKVVDRLLDGLASDVRDDILNTLLADDAPWTLVVVTSRDEIARRCETQIAIRR